MITKLAIVGSREFRGLDRVVRYVMTLPPETMVVTGGARGVDKTAESAAAIRRLSRCIFEPIPETASTYVQACLNRNELIAQMCDKMVIFWDGKSTGSMHAKACAERLNKPVEVIEENGK